MTDETECCTTTDNITGNYTVTIGWGKIQIICPYKDKCTSYPDRCGSCKRNTAKRDYYVPDPEDWYVPYPWRPWYPWYESTWNDNAGYTWVCCNSDGETHIYDNC